MYPDSICEEEQGYVNAFTSGTGCSILSLVVCVSRQSPEDYARFRKTDPEVLKWLTAYQNRDDDSYSVRHNHKCAEPEAPIHIKYPAIEEDYG